MKLRHGKMNVGAYWPPSTIERIDEARKGTYLSRGAFVLKNLLEHLDEIEEGKGKGRGAHPTKLSATDITTTSATSERSTSD